ncbi:MAG: hypothetical protein ACPG49_13485 [Chitinophagales bacterium]
MSNATNSADKKVRRTDSVCSKNNIGGYQKVQRIDINMARLTGIGTMYLGIS